MKYAIALLLPPLGLFMVGKVFQAILNLLLCCTLYGIPVACVWAVCVVASVEAQKRNERLVAAIEAQTRAAKKAAKRK